MYYRFRKNYIKSRSIEVPLSTFKGIDERVNNRNLPVGYTDDMRGMRVDHGIIKASLGISALRPRDGGEYADSQFEIDNIYPFYLGGKRELIASSEGRCFRLDDVDKRWKIVGSIYFSGQNSVMFTVDEEPSIIIPKKGGGLYSYNGVTFRDMGLTYSPVAMATHMNRLYLVDKGDEYRLRFSGINDPFNFESALDKGGEIYLDVEDGKIVKLISYGGNLYIFREYAIYKLLAYANQRDFVVKKVATTTTKIDGDSVVLTSNKMIYRAQDGLYIFDGYNTTRVLEQLENTLSRITVSEGCYFNGCYYLSYGIGTTKTDLMKWDMNTNESVMLSGTNIRKFSIIRSETDEECLAVAVDGVKKIGVIDDSYRYYDTDMDRYWSVSGIDMGRSDRMKCIDRVTPKSSDRYDLIITVDGKKYKYIVDGRRRYYPVNLRGYVYDFTIIPRGIGEITSPIIEYEV